MNEMYCVDSVLLIYYQGNEKCINSFKQDEITIDVFEKMKKYIGNNTIRRIELKNTKEDVSMTVFYENGMSHIGIVDMYNDMAYYYNDNSEDKTLVAISGQVFENYMICKDDNMLCIILDFFAKYGKRYPNIEWIEE